MPSDYHLQHSESVEVLMRYHDARKSARKKCHRIMPIKKSQSIVPVTARQSIVERPRCVSSPESVLMTVGKAHHLNDRPLIVHILRMNAGSRGWLASIHPRYFTKSRSPHVRGSILLPCAQKFTSRSSSTREFKKHIRRRKTQSNMDHH